MYGHDIINTICRYAWDYPVLGIARNELRFCCRSHPNKIPEKDYQREHHLFTGFIPIIEVRKSLLKGIRHPNCATCWELEDAVGRSPRTNFEEFSLWVHKHNVWPGLSRSEVRDRLLNLNDDLIEDLIKINVTRMIEISLGNTCDLKCVYCNHHYSSQWATEKLKYKEITLENIEDELPKTNTLYEDIFWKWFEIESGASTHAINFIGGEPLIIDKFYTYLDRIISFYEINPPAKDYIDISVVSNFNTPPKLYQKFLSKTLDIILSEKIKLDMNVSIESIGKRAEFIRTGTDWELLNSNINKFISYVDMTDLNKDDRKVIFNLQIALNALCVSDLPNFFRYVVDLEKNNERKIHIRQNQITDPGWLSPGILPPEYVVYIDESIKIIEEHLAVQVEKNTLREYSPFGSWDRYVIFLKSVRKNIENPNKNIQARKDFAYNIDKLCERRKLNFHETFPEMIEFYNLCKGLN